MKTLFFTIGLGVLSAVSFAQKNNPYNQRGIDFVTSVNMITTDFNAGKVKEINEQSLKKYSKLIPLQNQVSLDLASSVTKTLKAPGFNFYNFVKSSSLSDYAKNMIVNFINFKKLPVETFKNSLVEKVNELNVAKIDRNEKELLLSLVAIAYNSTATSFSGRLVSCEVTGPNGTTTLSQGDCTGVCAVIGAVIGYGICGPLCALGGAVLGAVVGSMS